MKCIGTQSPVVSSLTPSSTSVGLMILSWTVLRCLNRLLLTLKPL